MVQISEGGEPVKVPLAYYDKYGERSVVGEAAVQIKNGEVIVVGKIEAEVDGDVIQREILGGINLESFSMSVDPFTSATPSTAFDAARRLGPLARTPGSTKHFTDSNPNGEIRQCNRQEFHDPHEWSPGTSSVFNVYCLGYQGSER